MTRTAVSAENTAENIDLSAIDVLPQHPPGAWREYADDSRNPILLAAMRCFMRSGYHGTSIRNIAAEAGLSVPGIYHHWPSKHSILSAMMAEGMNDLWWRAVQAVEEAGPSPLDQFTNVIRCLLQFHTIRRDEAFVALTEIRSLDSESRATHIARRDRQQRQIDEVVFACVEAGLVTTPYPKDASRAVVTICTSVSQWFNPAGELSSEEIVDRYLDICLAAVQAQR